MRSSADAANRRNIGAISRLRGFACTLAVVGAVTAIAAGPMALTVAAAAQPARPAEAMAPLASPAPGDWPQYRGNAAHTGNNPVESTISAANVSRLKVKWSNAVNLGPNPAMPAISNGWVYAGSIQHGLIALSAQCGGCDWWGGTGDLTATAQSPAVADGRVFTTRGGDLVAYDPTKCTAGQGGCQPVWKIAAPLVHGTPAAVGAAPVVAGKVLYLTMGSALEAFSDTCGEGGKTCAPLWTANDGRGFLNGTPTIADGMVFISDAVTLWAYKVGCNVGGGVCTPVWSAAINPLSMGYASTPAVSGGVVYMSGAQKLYAFDEKCGSGGATCTPLWTAAIVEGQTPAVGNGAVFVTGSERLGSTRLVMAVQTGCRSDGGRCSILWKGGAGEDVNTAPAVANGLVFAGGAHGKVVAFGAACGTGGAACQPLWSAATMDWPMENSPAIANGTLYMAAENRAVYAFTLASAGNVTPPPTNSGSSETTRNGGELPIAALLALAALFGTTVAFVRTQQPARP